MERKIYWNGELFDCAEAAREGAYELCNRCDDLCDMFEEMTIEEKKQGMTYGEWVIVLK